MECPKFWFIRFQRATAKNDDCEFETMAIILSTLCSLLALITCCSCVWCRSFFRLCLIQADKCLKRNNDFNKDWRNRYFPSYFFPCAGAQGESLHWSLKAFAVPCRRRTGQDVQSYLICRECYKRLHSDERRPEVAFPSQPSFVSTVGAKVFGVTGQHSGPEIAFFGANHEPHNMVVNLNSRGLLSASGIDKLSELLRIVLQDDVQSNSSTMATSQQILANGLGVADYKGKKYLAAVALPEGSAWNAILEHLDNLIKKFAKANGRKQNQIPTLRRSATIHPSSSSSDPWEPDPENQGQQASMLHTDRMPCTPPIIGNLPAEGSSTDSSNQISHVSTNSSVLLSV